MANSKIMQAVVEIAGNISPTLASSIQSATKKLDGLNVKAIAVGAAAAAGAVAIGKAIIDAGSYLNDLGAKFDDVTDTIRIGTGATGEDLEALVDSFNAVYGSVPTTMEDASKAISDYNTRLGLTGTALEDISVQALQVSDMLGEDLGTVIESSSQAFQNWGLEAEDMGDAMDYIFKVSQSTGVGFSTLMGEMQTYGAQLQAVGYDFNSAATMLGQVEKAGLDATTVMTALKTAATAASKAGFSSVSEGLETYFERIKNAESETRALEIATNVFGSKAAATMVSAIQNGTLSLAEMQAQLEANSETINAAAEDTYDYAEMLQIIKQKGEVALQPLANSVFQMINDLMPVLTDLMDGVIPIIESLTESLVPIVQSIVPSILPMLQELVPVVLELGGSLAKDIIPPIVEIFTSLLPVAVEMIKTISPAIQAIVQNIMPLFTSLAKNIVPVVNEIITSVLPLLSKLLEALLPIFNALNPVITLLSDIIGGVLGAAIEAITPIIENLTNVLGGIVDFVTNVFTGNWADAWQAVVNVFGSIFGTLEALLKAPLNAIIKVLNWFIGKINTISVSLPDWKILGDYAGYTIGFNIPEIPMLAKGGFTDGISIAGEAGQEAVISFDPLYRTKNLDVWAEAGRMLGVPLETTYESQAAKLLTLDDFSLAGQAGGAGNTIVYDFSNFTWAPQVDATGSNEDDFMAKLKQHEADFFDWLQDFARLKEVSVYG